MTTLNNEVTGNSLCFPAEISACMNCSPSTCDCFKNFSWSNQTIGNSKYESLDNVRIYILIVIGIISLIVNTIVTAALIKSWKKLLQKSIYIFAISISVCDAILALVNTVNGGQHLYWNSHQNSSTQEDLLREARWFYPIRVSIFLATELSSAGHTALIAMAFHRFVCAQLNKDVVEIPTKFKQKKIRRSVLLSRRTTLSLSVAMWILATAVFITGLLWNCSGACECFLEKGSFLETRNTARCFQLNGCSYLFEPIKKIYGLICGVLFFIALGIIIFYGVQTIRISGGGLASVLPYRLHILWIKKGAKQNQKNGSAPKQKIENSLQLSYHRHMTHFIFYVMLIYLVCRFPANFFLVLDSLYPGDAVVGLVVIDILSIIAFVHSLLNPIVYFFSLHHTKQAVFDLIDSCCITKVEVQQTKAQTNSSPPVEDKSATLKRSAANHSKHDAAFTCRAVIEA